MIAAREVHHSSLSPIALRALLAVYNSIPLTPALLRERASLIRQLENVKP